MKISNLKLATLAVIASQATAASAQFGDFLDRAKLPAELAASVQTLTEKDCDENCTVAAIVLPRNGNRQPSPSLCFDNPLFRDFILPSGEVQPGMTTAAKLSWQGEESSGKQTLRIFLSQSLATGGRLCAPATVKWEKIEMHIAEVGVLTETSPPEEVELDPAGGTSLGLTGGSFGNLVGSLTNKALLKGLFGFDSSEVIRVRINSAPEGAELIVDERPSGYQTNNVIAIAKRLLPSLKVRLQEKEVGLPDCDRQSTRPPLVAEFDCDLAN